MENDRVDEVDALEEKLSSCAETLRKQLGELSGCISEGYIPCEEDLVSLNKEFSELQDDYNKIIGYAKSILSNNEMPQENSPIFDYITAIRNNRSKFAEEQLNSIWLMLKRFISVKSHIETYSVALEPFQRQAEKLLNDVGIDNVNKIVESEIYESAKYFLQALDIDNFECDEGLQLCEKIIDMYSPKVQFGLARKQYYLEETNDNEVINNEISEMGKDNCKPEESSELLQQSDSTEESELDENDLGQDDISDESVNEQNATVTEDYENSSKEENIKAVNVTDDINELYTHNKVKKANPSASAFKKEITRLPKETGTILPLLTNLGALTEDQFFGFGVAMDCLTNDNVAKEGLKECIDLLSNKGYLSKFTGFKHEEIAYCLTTYTYGCLKKETVIQLKNYFRVTFGKYSIVTDDKVNRSDFENVIDYNNILLLYFLGIKKILSQREYNIVKSSIGMVNGSYNVKVIYKEKEYLCTLYNPHACNDKYTNLLVIEKYYTEKNLPTYERLFIYSEGNITQVGYKGNIVNEVDENSEELNQQVFPTNDTSYDEVNIEKKKKTDYKQIESNDTGDESYNKSDDYAIQDSNISELYVLINNSKAPKDCEFISLIKDIINGKYNSESKLSDIVRATILAKSAAFNEKNSQTKILYEKLLAATRIPIDTYTYSSEELSNTFIKCEDECLLLSAYMQALFIPENSYDYNLMQQATTFIKNFDSCFPSLGSFKPLFNKLIEIHEIAPSGFTASTMALLGNDTEEKKVIENFQQKAEHLLEILSTKNKVRASQKWHNDLFGNNSELHYCITIIAEKRINDCEFVKEVLKEYCCGPDDEYIINTILIDNALDKALNNTNSNMHYKLEPKIQTQIQKQFKNCLDLIKDWVEHISKSGNTKLDIDRLQILKEDILKQVTKAKSTLQTVNAEYSNVLLWTFNYIETCLTKDDKTSSFFDEFIRTGIFSISKEGIPIIDQAINNNKFYEPWRNILRHIVSPIKSLEMAKTEIYNNKSILFDNLHQLELIDMKLPDNNIKFKISKETLKEAINNAEEQTTKFREKLELEYTYNRINEPEKERFIITIEKYKHEFFQTKDFGCWKQFLNALEQEIDLLKCEKKLALRRELDARKSSLKDDEHSTILGHAEELLEKDSNFAVTEEYLNRFDNGEKEISTELLAILKDEDSYADFISDNKFLPLYDECKRCMGKTMKSFALPYLDKRMPREWTTRQRTDSENLVNNWPIRKGNTQAISINRLFTSIGFKVNNVTKNNKINEDLFEVEFEPTPKSMADYRHPISMFGTQMKSPLNVVVLYGNYAPKQLVDTIVSMDFRGISLVLIDKPIDRTSRRNIAEIFHTQTSGQNPFILIDQVLALYMAMHQITERLPILLKCTLPYSTYQPFVRDGGSTADEMFYGRVNELATIIDPKGASIVYGGRQLGKTALLQRAENLFSNTVNKNYAVYCNIINCETQKQLVVKIIDNIHKKTNLEFESCDTIDELCKQFDVMFRNENIKSMLLLLDESDCFLSHIAEDKYRPLQPFIDLKRETNSKFKFVLAGLHNVCRAKNATIENGVFGQLGTPLCVKPLSPTDALQLLLRPLKYLGFKIDEYPHLETILTNTNYYPGILQFFGYMLVEALSSQYSKYYHASTGNPPFTLKDDQLGAIMNDADLNSSIKNKFIWSLELDQRYYMIARCITLLYHYRDETTDNWYGFSVEEIINIAESYGIRCLTNLSRSEFIILLDEMEEMGILSKPNFGLYRLRRSTFFNIIGSDIDALEKEIERNNKEVTV